MQLHQKWQDRGLSVITLNMEGADKLPEAEMVLKSKHMAVTNFSLADSDSDETLAILETDGSFGINLYDREGKLRFQLDGMDHDELEQRVATLLDE